MTLTPAEVDRLARGRYLFPYSPCYVDGLLCMYWRLTLNRPTLDMDDTRAIVKRYHELQPPAAPGEGWKDLERSTESFWKTPLRGDPASAAGDGEK